MEYQMLFVYALAAVVLSIGVLQVYSWNQYRKYKFPPTPPGRLPLIGHAHLMPKRFPGDKAKEWGMNLLRRANC
jgi:hypothetical protein